MRIFDAQRCKTREPRFKRHPSGGATVGLKLRKKPAPNPSLIGGFKPPCGGKWGFTGARPPWRAKKRTKGGLRGFAPVWNKNRSRREGHPSGGDLPPRKAILLAFSKSDFYEHFFRALRYVHIFSALIPVLARPHVCRIHTTRTNPARILFTNWEGFARAKETLSPTLLEHDGFLVETRLLSFPSFHRIISTRLRHIQL